MKIVTIHPVYALDKKFYWWNLMVFNKVIECDYEFWCLKWKLQRDFEIEWQKRFWSTKFWLCVKLRKEAKSIKLLHSYHIRHRSLIYGFIFKIRNPKGVYYIKLDLWRQNINGIKYIFRPFILPIILLSDYIWYEDNRVWNRLTERYPKHINKIIRTTNAIQPVDKYIWNLCKEDVILLCGRFGSKQKNNELLISMLINNDIDFLRWRTFKLLWTYTDEFLLKLTTLFELKPNLKEQFILPWFITNTIEKYKYFSTAKIFLHTANFEWDPNIQYDAMFWWCFMISTDIANISQNYPKKSSLFYKIKDELGLLKQLKKWIDITNKLKEKDYINIQNHCLHNFTWEKMLYPIIKKLDHDED